MPNFDDPEEVTRRLAEKLGKQQAPTTSKKDAVDDDVIAAAKKARGAVKKTEKRTYKVVSGDSLSAISQKMYGAGGHWKAIYEANKETIGADPNMIQIGQELVIPELDN